MRSLTTLAVEIYQQVKKPASTITEGIHKTKQYILTEVSQWSITSLQQGNNYHFKPKEFSGDQSSSPFEVRLVKLTAMEGFYELKFGNLNAETDQEMFEWSDKDPYKLAKALFLRNVLSSKIKDLFETGKIMGIMFQPYQEDGLGSDRFSYFYNMYSKLGKDKYDLEEGEFELEGTYFITPKI